MITTVLKGFKLSSKEKEKLLNPFNKTLKRLPRMSSDVFRLALFLKRKNQSRKKIEQKNYLGNVTLILPHHRFHSFFSGKTIRQSIKKGADLTLRQLQKYKELHFKSNSRYPHHQTIRKEGI